MLFSDVWKAGRADWEEEEEKQIGTGGGGGGTGCTREPRPGGEIAPGPSFPKRMRAGKGTQ